MSLTGIPIADRFPRMLRVKQQFAGPTVADATEATRQALARLALPVRPGQSVALTVGSRGIVNIDVVVRAAVAHLQALGAHPFIIPAMGSHGGGTAEGQQKVLARYGVTEATMGCPDPRRRWTWSRSARCWACRSGSTATRRRPTGSASSTGSSPTPASRGRSARAC